MSSIDYTSPREAARAFTPKLSALVDSPLYDSVWEDPDLSKRDRSLVTVAALVATARFEELPAHLRRARENGVTRTELGDSDHPPRLLCGLSRRDHRFGDRQCNARSRRLELLSGHPR